MTRVDALVLSRAVLDISIRVMYQRLD